jgi:serine/threonine-protein kinase
MKDAADVTFPGLVGLRTVGRYEIQRRIGRGGAGLVYLGNDPYIQRPVAIKISRPDSEKARRRFFVEAQSAGRLNHPNIVAIYDAGLLQDYCYIAMEYIEGQTLGHFCRPERLLPLDVAVSLLLSICIALDYAHRQKIVHRDIKPTNILLTSALVPKITDFGIAQLADITLPGDIQGTPSYMAPEQLRGKQVSPRSDLFALGCVLHEMLTGQQAFGGENCRAIVNGILSADPKPLRELRPELPEILQGIVDKALAKDPRRRYHSAMDMAYDLRVAQRGITGKSGVEQVKDLVDFVHHVPFFRAFSREQLHELVGTCRIGKVRQGKVIVSEGEIDDTFYVLLSGRVDILKGDREVAEIRSGECFGEMAYISGRARSATARARSDCVLMEISAQLLDRSPATIQLQFFKSFASALVQRLARAPVLQG